MQDNPITDDQTDDYRPQFLMDEEDWQAAFGPYEGRSSDAQTLGCKLGMLRAYLDAQTIKCRHAIEALDLALEVFVSAYEFSRCVFRLVHQAHSSRTNIRRGTSGGDCFARYSVLSESFDSDSAIFLLTFFKTSLKSDRVKVNSSEFFLGTLESEVGSELVSEGVEI